MNEKFFLDLTEKVMNALQNNEFIDVCNVTENIILKIITFLIYGNLVSNGFFSQKKIVIDLSILPRSYSLGNIIQINLIACLHSFIPLWLHNDLKL